MAKRDGPPLPRPLPRFILAVSVWEMDMGAAFYNYLRSGSGFSLIVFGLSFMVNRRRYNLAIPLGILFSSVGMLFSMSFLSNALALQVDVDYLIQVILTCLIGQSFYQIGVYVLGGAKSRRSTLPVFLASSLWSLLIFLLPLLDYALELRPSVHSVEDEQLRAPLHALGAALLYAWPILATATALGHARFGLADISLRVAKNRNALLLILSVMPILILIACSLVLQERFLYRIGHSGLAVYMVVLYVFITRFPRELGALRQAIGEEHHRRLNIDANEEAEIRQRLRHLVEARRVYTVQGLTIDGLAKELKVPGYRLSRYFSQCESTRFPAWLNGLRIGHVCAEMRADPKRNILEIAMEAGFTSKTTFNKQFQELMGKSPSQYRDGGA